MKNVLLLLSLLSLMGCQALTPPKPLKPRAIQEPQVVKQAQWGNPLCEVSHVFDGDTIQVKCDNQRVKVRLACVDGPESSQEGGQEAKQFLYSYLQTKGSYVTLNPITQDKYGRVVAEVYVGNTSLQEALLLSGNARIYERYANCPSIQTFRGAQGKAQAQRVGIWGYASVPPEEYRKMHKD